MPKLSVIAGILFTMLPAGGILVDSWNLPRSPEFYAFCLLTM
jgi:hypothetical protein